MLFLKEVCGPQDVAISRGQEKPKGRPRSRQQDDQGSVCPDREVLAQRPHTTLSKHVLALRTSLELALADWMHWDHGTKCFQHGMWQPYVESTGTQRRCAWADSAGCRDYATPNAEEWAGEVRAGHAVENDREAHSKSLEG